MNAHEQENWRHLQRAMVIESLGEQDAKIVNIGTVEYQGADKYRYYRASWYIQEAVKMLRSIGQREPISRIVAIDTSIEELERRNGNPIQKPQS